MTTDMIPVSTAFYHAVWAMCWGFIAATLLWQPWRKRR